MSVWLKTTLWRDICNAHILKTNNKSKYENIAWLWFYQSLRQILRNYHNTHKQNKGADTQNSTESYISTFLTFSMLRWTLARIILVHTVVWYFYYSYNRFYKSVNSLQDLNTWYQIIHTTCKVKSKTGLWRVLGDGRQ